MGNKRQNRPDKNGNCSSYPLSVGLTIYDISSEKEKQILSVRGELTDENTLTVDMLSDEVYPFDNLMFYEGTVSQIVISRIDR